MTPVQTDLLSKAKEAALCAYCPYSKFRVGSAVLANGKIYLGANVENSSSNLGICAERVAIAKAIIDGSKQIEGIAIYCIDAAKINGEYIEMNSLPCGACLQWIAELAKDAWIITNASKSPYSLNQLLPKAFSL